MELEQPYNYLIRQYFIEITYFLIDISLYFSTNFESLDSFESEIFGDGVPRRSSENNLASMSSHSSSCPMDIIPQNQREGYWGSDSTLNLSGLCSKNII